jgi:uncharacterized damage-inducible protein DinB
MNRREMMHSLALVGGVSAAAMAAESKSFALGWRDSFLKHWRVTKDYTIAVAEAMPVEHYDFKPTPPQRTFAEQLVHLGRANSAYVSAWGLSKILDAPKASDKATVRKYLADSFDQVAEVTGKLGEKDLLRNDLGAPRFPAHAGTDLLLRAYMHTAHHRGQAVVYLRLKGIQPPEWAFQPTA